jgi:hypothetical protein
MPWRRRPQEAGVPVWVMVAATTIYVVHALNYLYFFVDDEAIPYVYAQNLLRGHGLTYNLVEGRVEGYSDFLHVVLSTVILAFTRAAGFPKLSVFFIGKAVSLGCGLAVLYVAWRVMRQQGTGRTGAMTGLGWLALGAPLALWSNSSLETVPFALLTVLLAAALSSDRNRWAALAAVLMVLERIDGFVYAGVLIGVFLLTASAGKRRLMLSEIVLPVSVLLIAYHGWRWWYFGNLMPAPLEAKVLHKLMQSANVMVKKPETGYLRGFIGVLGWPAAVALAAACAHAIRIGGSPRRLALAVLLLVAYVSRVGDWMFGFRFFVALLPVFSLILAASAGAIAATRPRLAAALCLGLLVYSGVTAARFVATYNEGQSVPSFLHGPSRDLHRFFWPYYGLYEMARTLMGPGEVVAYNQAGFIPFMLDLNNIDDLGICSRFPAEVPTTDLYFTEVGRYVPLTNKRTLRPVQAYVLYRDAQYVMSRTDILARANHGTIPPALFGGHYELVGMDAARLNAVYRRTAQNGGQPAIAPRLFAENLAHVSYVRRARIDSAEIPPAEYIRRLPFLHDDGAMVPLTGRFELLVDYAERDEPVTALSIAELRADVPAEIELRLLGQDQRLISREVVSIEANQSRSIHVEMPPGTAASRIFVGVSSTSGLSGRVWIEDLRVQGQRPALEAYIARHLRFPPDRSPRGP